MNVQKPIRKRCRICYETSEIFYPLYGDIPFVDVHISEMLTYCTSVKVDEVEDLPKEICLPCFKTLRIAYNFIKKFKETNEWLLEQRIKKEVMTDHEYTKEYSNQDMSNDTTEHSDDAVDVHEEQVQEEEEHFDDAVDVHEEEHSNDAVSVPEEQIQEEEGEENTFTMNEDLGENFAYSIATSDGGLNIINNLNEYIQNGVVTVSPNGLVKVYQANEEDIYLTEDPPDTQIISYLSAVDQMETEKVEENLVNMEEKLEDSTTELLNYMSSDNNVEDTVDHENVSNKAAAPRMQFRRKYIRQFVCPRCPNQRFNESDYIYHIGASHLGDEELQCNMCNLEVNFTAEEFVNHFISVHKFQCHICTDSFGRRNSLYAHMRKHSNIRYKCSFEGCGKSFVTAWSLKKHDNIHRGEEKYNCEKCGLWFKTYDTYRYHLKTHNGRKHLCMYCGKSYLQSVHLKYHLWNHSDMKQFSCNLCPKRYTSITVLRKHKRKHHPDDCK